MRLVSVSLIVCQVGSFLHCVSCIYAMFYNEVSALKFVNMSKRQFENDLRASEVEHLFQSELDADNDVDVSEQSKIKIIILYLNILEDKTDNDPDFGQSTSCCFSIFWK